MVFYKPSKRRSISKILKRFKTVNDRKYENSGIYKLKTVNHFILLKQAKCLK